MFEKLLRLTRDFEILLPKVSSVMHFKKRIVDVY